MVVLPGIRDSMDRQITCVGHVAFDENILRDRRNISINIDPVHAHGDQEVLQLVRGLVQVLIVDVIVADSPTNEVQELE